MLTQEDIRERDAELCAVIEQQQEQLGVVLAHVEELRARNERLTHELDKAHRLLNQSIGWQRDAEIAKAKKDILIERLMNAIQRIDGINDYPANYSPGINAVCDEILRPHLESKP